MTEINQSKQLDVAKLRHCLGNTNLKTMKHLLILLLILFPVNALANNLPCNEVHLDKSNNLFVDLSGNPYSGMISCTIEGLKFEKSFLNGKYHGPDRSWKNDILVKDITFRIGQRHGLYYQCNDVVSNGINFSECKYGNFLNDKRHGKWVTITENKNGEKSISLSIYSNGKFIDSNPNAGDIF